MFRGLAVLLIAFSLPILAQEEDGPPPAPLAGIAARLAGTDAWFGMYAGTRNVGWIHHVVSDAGDGRIQFEMAGRISYPGQATEMTSVLVTDSDLSLVTFTLEERAGQRTERISCTAPAGGKASWETEVSFRPEEGGEAGPPLRESKSIEIPPGAFPAEILFLVLEEIEWTEGERYAFSTLGRSGETLRLLAGWPREGTAAPRGIEMPAVHIRVVGPKGDAPLVVSLAGGRIVQAAPDDSAMRFVAGTSEEAKQDLPAPEETPDEKAVREVVLDFLRGLSSGDESVIDRTLDLAAIQARHAKQDPTVASMTAQEFRAGFEQWIKSQGGRQTPEEVGEYLAIVRHQLEVETDGDAATVSGHPRSGPFLLERKDGAWKIVWWNRFGE